MKILALLSERIRLISPIRRRQVILCFYILLIVFFPIGYFVHFSSSFYQFPTDSKSQLIEIYTEDGIIPLPVFSEKHLFPPKIAIVIDDVGYDTESLLKLLRLKAVLSFSVLPRSPNNKVAMGKILETGSEIMLHLPMEPIEYPEENPGPGALFAKMSAEEIERRVEQNIQEIIHVKGVNNHMGSRMTAIPGQMVQIMSVLKRQKLFYIDSFTTPNSVCRSSAQLLQIPFARRDIFLDHIPNVQSICNQLKLLIRIAESQGEAVGIGHCNPFLYEALSEMLPEIKKRVILVPASQIVHTIG